MWGFIYVSVFLIVFVISIIVKISYHPGLKDYSVKWDSSMGTIYTDIPYGENNANRFDIYVPADNTKKTYGLVVYLHAGGFTTGDKSDDAEMLKWLCSKGYVAAGINYTLRDEKHPQASVYSQSMEIKQSMPYIAEKAKELGYPVDKMAISGGSAGGTLALLYAYRDADTSPIPVKMVFELAGPASFHHEDWKNYGLDQNEEAAANLFSIMSGNNITVDMIESDDYDNEIRDISACMWINNNSVPSVIAYGVYDKICPFDSSRHLINALKENNVPYDYFEFPHSGHGLQNDDKIYIQYMEKVCEYLDRYLGR